MKSTAKNNTTEISLTSLYEKAVATEQAEHQVEESTKVGNLRGGNSGLLLEDGQVAGSCHRRAYIRMLGLEVDPPPANRLIMFDAGKFNEDYWFAKLGKSWTGTVLRESEVPTCWTTTNGKKVTGRPDLVLVDPAGVRVLGLELKMVASIWTARDVRFQGQPKLSHLTQAAHYMWQLGIPYRLIYTSYVDFAMVDWARKLFPLRDHPLAVHLEYNEKGDAKKVLPFHSIYSLRFDSSGKLQYCEEGTGRWETTIVDIQGIQGYYDYISSIEETKNLGPRVSTLDLSGKKEGYSSCNYCPLNSICDKTSDHDKWLTEVRRVAGGKK